jgi:hypothetical protein
METRLRHPSAGLPREWDDVCAVLAEFRLRKSWLTQGGGCPIPVFGISKALYVEDS